MKHLFVHLDALKEKIKQKHLFLFLDYDGTLTPIRRTPEEAVISQKALALLRDVSKSKTVKIVIVTGRSLREIRELLGIKNISYIGNHGLEFQSGTAKPKNFVPLHYRKIIDKIGADIKQKTLFIKGAFLEDKGFTLSLHYRMVHSSNLPRIERIINGIKREKKLMRYVRINSGKKVFEIKPKLPWNKGKAVLRWLKEEERKNVSSVSIYIGDDITDEDAFKALKNGITVRVGKSKTSLARYYLNGTGEVVKFIKVISFLKKEADKCLN